jgi:hypothetical protein
MVGMDQPGTPSAEELARRAMEASAEAFAAIVAASAGATHEETHAAWEVLFHESQASSEPASDPAVWIRHSAGNFLIGVGSLAKATADAEGAASAEQLRKVNPAGEQLLSAWRALAAGRLDEAATLAHAVIDSQPEGEDDEDEPDADLVHYGQLVLGHVCLEQGDEDGAERHLLAAGAAGAMTSPVLSSFGPNMALARKLLLRGRREAVLAYFAECARFWGPLPQWTAAVEAGGMPAFGPNLIYGMPDEVQDLI